MLTARFQQDLALFLQERGQIAVPARLTELLEPFLPEERKQRIATVIQQRCLRVIPVLDQIYDSGNINAALRSMEGLGFAAVDLVQSQSQFRAANRFSAGADKWLSIRKWSSSQQCIQQLKAAGFAIVATDLNATVEIAQWDWSQKTAVVFGNEHQGVSPDFLAQADARIRVPMQGFTQSFNISVATALILREIQLHFPRTVRDSDEEALIRQLLRVIYYLKSVQHPHALLSGLLERSMLPLGHGEPAQGRLSQPPALP